MELQPLPSMDRTIGAVFSVVLWGSSPNSPAPIFPKARNREGFRITLP